MSLLTLAALEIGKVTVKSTLKYWFKDSSLGDDISSELADLIGSKLPDVFDQRKANRLFEGIVDKISKSVLPLLESKRSSLDEGECRSIALAAVDTLNQSKLTKVILLQHNLQPSQLEQYICKNANPQLTEGFSQAGIGFYNRLIKEICTYIIDISSLLPPFTEHTFVDVLQKEDMIIQRVNQTLEYLRKIGEDIDPKNKFDQFEKEYREAVARNLDILQLIGADVSLPNRRHKLSVAYITLSVTHKHSHQDITSNPLREEDQSFSDIRSVNEALASSNRLLICGPAGSGKTTLLQWIAVGAATKSFDGQLANWSGIVPFYIRLRHYAQSQLPKPEIFPEFAAPAILDTMPKGWVHHLLRSGRALLLIDGVDEVSATQREAVQTWLRDLIATYKDCRFIVTSRPHAIEDGWMSHDAFDETTLQEMSMADIELFIDHWHEAVRQELHAIDEKNELDSLAEHLKNHARKTRPIRRLATNPLLCAMLCALNRERRGQLPLNRIELYQACCSLLLDRREKESRVDLSDYPNLNYSQKMRFLAHLAYTMVRENLSEVAIAHVDTIFSHQLVNMTNMAQDTTGKSIRRFLVHRSGIIREPIQEQIDFTHRTVQDFFAAQAVLAASDIEYLISVADQWPEVVILAAGLANQYQCEQLIKGIIARGDEQKELRHQLHLIAISSLETAVELTPEIQRELDQRLSQLVPPKNITEAKALASAGELAVKYLRKKQLGKISAATCIACIRALSIIGDDTALDALEEYAVDTREKVIDELVKSWDMFNKQIYAQRILSKIFKNRSKLRLERVSSLEGIEYLANLDELSLHGCNQLTDLSPLALLHNLNTLHLSSCNRLTSISLTNLPKINTLSLHDFPQLTDLSLTDLPKLNTLNLYDFPQLTNLSLTDLPNLDTLDLPGCYQLTAIRLINLSNLNTLSLFDRNQLTTICLTNLPNISTLSFHNCYKLTDLSLTDLPNLSILDLRGCYQLTAIRQTNLPNLHTVELRGCSQLTDLSPLASLPNLHVLNLFHCSQLTDLSPLALLPNLRILDLRGCQQLTDLSPLAHLPNLTIKR